MLGLIIWRFIFFVIILGFILLFVFLLFLIGHSVVLSFHLSLLHHLHSLTVSMLVRTLWWSIELCRMSLWHGTLTIYCEILLIFLFNAHSLWWHHVLSSKSIIILFIVCIHQRLIWFVIIIMLSIRHLSTIFSGVIIWYASTLRIMVYILEIINCLIKIFKLPITSCVIQNHRLRVNLTA